MLLSDRWPQNDKVVVDVQQHVAEFGIPHPYGTFQHSLEYAANRPAMS
jgi:hypothetical protein